MTKQQMVEEFRQLKSRSKISFLRELLENQLTDEIREDICDFLLALEADKEEGEMTLEEYERSRSKRKGTAKKIAKFHVTGVSNNV